MRVEEREQDHLAAQPGQAHDLAMLVPEREVGRRGGMGQGRADERRLRFARRGPGEAGQYDPGDERRDETTDGGRGHDRAG